MKNLIYKVIPTDTFKISRGCGGCGCKQNFVSRKTFRVNANGNKLDVWMIYGCEKCNHTYNLPVYERIRPDRMNKEEYQKFLSNDEEAIFQYGKMVCEWKHSYPENRLGLLCSNGCNGK